MISRCETRRICLHRLMSLTGISLETYTRSVQTSTSIHKIFTPVISQKIKFTQKSRLSLAWQLPYLVSLGSRTVVSIWFFEKLAIIFGRQLSYGEEKNADGVVFDSWMISMSEKRKSMLCLIWGNLHKLAIVEYLFFSVVIWSISRYCCHLCSRTIENAYNNLLFSLLFIRSFSLNWNHENHSANIIGQGLGNGLWIRTKIAVNWAERGLSKCTRVE